MMNCTDIHNSFDNKEVRDFLSKSIVNTYEKEFLNNNRSNIPIDDDDAWMRSIAKCKDNILFHQKLLEILEERGAVMRLMGNIGWNEFDVSDMVRNNTGKKLCMCFIGTQDEYDELVKDFN